MFVLCQFWFERVLVLELCYLFCERETIDLYQRKPIYAYDHARLIASLWSFMYGNAATETLRPLIKEIRT